MEDFGRTGGVIVVCLAAEEDFCICPPKAELFPLNEVGTKRDAVTAALANGDAAAIPDLQMILIELEEKATF
jgi:hypothetical protein